MSPKFMRLSRIFSFRDREEGASAVEYAILVASIAFAIGSGSLIFGESLDGKFNKVAKEVSDKAPSNSTPSVGYPDGGGGAVDPPSPGAKDAGGGYAPVDTTSPEAKDAGKKQNGKKDKDKNGKGNRKKEKNNG